MYPCRVCIHLFKSVRLSLFVCYHQWEKDDVFQCSTFFLLFTRFFYVFFYRLMRQRMAVWTWQRHSSRLMRIFCYAKQLNLIIGVINYRECIRKRKTINKKGAFLTSGNSKLFTILPNNYLFIRTFTYRRRSQPCKVTASSSKLGVFLKW